MGYHTLHSFLPSSLEFWVIFLTATHTPHTLYEIQVTLRQMCHALGIFLLHSTRLNGVATTTERITCALYLAM